MRELTDYVESSMLRNSRQTVRAVQWLAAPSLILLGGACDGAGRKNSLSGDVAAPSTSIMVPHAPGSAVPLAGTNYRLIAGPGQAAPGSAKSAAANVVDDSTNPPGVRSRVHLVDGNNNTTITQFDASRLRPNDYPDSLPFVPGVVSSVTRNGTSARDAGAHWLVETAATQQAIVREVTTQLLAGGWREIGAQPMAGQPGYVSARRFTRNGNTRILLTATVGGGFAVQLTQENVK